MNILKKGVALCLALSAAVAAQAQGVIEGYFRVSNAETGKYVEVTGPFSADPTAEKNEAQYKAGTIIYVAAEQNGRNQWYDVTSLRSQGIEVVGNYIDDYYQTLTDILLTENGFNDSTEALWALVREGFNYGYTSIGRAAIQSMIFIVASRLDQEPNITVKDELADFAKRFNEEVAQYIDLGIRLEPVAGAPNTFRLYYETPTLDAVSEWYLKPQNKETFEKGFAAMRNYLTNKMGLTGEGFDASEVKEMQDWGYTLPDKYRNNPNADGVFVVSYEEIFADPELLFNWLKLNVIKFTDVERCPKIELQGLYLPKFAEEMQKHRLTQEVISYLPQLQPNQRIYLCDGKNGRTGHFDFTSADGANQLGSYAQWVMHPVDNKTEIFSVKNEYPFEDKFYSAVYFDFPVSAIDDNTQVNLLSKEVMDAKGYAFVKLLPVDKVPLQTALVISSTADESQLNVADGNTTIIELEPVVKAPDNSLIVSSDPDKKADKQYVRRRANENTEDEASSTPNDKFTGVLLSSMLSNIPNYTGIDPYNNLYYFQGSKEVSELNNNYLVFGEFTKDQLVGPNVALFTCSPVELSPEDDMILIGTVQINVAVGETKTNDEDDDNSDVPEEEQAKVAQVFNGTEANTFKNLINFSVELEYGKDFTVNVTTPEKVDDSEWESPADPEKLNKSYLDAFLLMQPNPFEKGTADYNNYVPGLYTQYEDLFADKTASDMSEDFVDGFYLASHLDQDETAVLEDPTKAENSATGYEYDLVFDAPCSGRYQVTVAPSEKSAVDFNQKTFYVKILPNLYGTFGESKTPGFNIEGYSFKFVDGIGYVIYLPLYEMVQNDKGEWVQTEFNLDGRLAYIPGTYFASKLSAKAGDQESKTRIKRKTDENGGYKYYTELPDMSEIVNTEIPLTVTIEKNGVSKDFDFYVKQDSSVLTTGIETISGEETTAPVYYNLQGVKVATPDHGIFIKVEGRKVSKVVL